jgi:DNA-binding NtrC family response regulator
MDTSVMAPKTVTGKGRILCVDDEPAILRSLQWLLRRRFEVSVAPGGAEALALLRDGDFDVVVSDQRMPGMSGAELLREVRRLSPRSMRILLTGYSDIQAILRSVNEGEVFRFIHKPWDVNELPEVID